MTTLYRTRYLLGMLCVPLCRLRQIYRRERIRFHQQEQLSNVWLFFSSYLPCNLCSFFLWWRRDLARSRSTFLKESSSLEPRLRGIEATRRGLDNNSGIISRSHYTVINHASSHFRGPRPGPRLDVLDVKGQPGRRARWNVRESQVQRHRGSSMHVDRHQTDIYQIPMPTLEARVVNRTRLVVVAANGYASTTLYDDATTRQQRNAGHVKLQSRSGSAGFTGRFASDRRNCVDRARPVINIGNVRYRWE